MENSFPLFTTYSKIYLKISLVRGDLVLVLWIVIFIFLISLASVYISVKNAPILHEGKLLTEDEYSKIDKK